MFNLPRQYVAVEQLASRVAAQVTFPLENFGDLAAALGGESAEVEWRGKRQNLGQVRKSIPDGFFPVESREDLIVKVAYLETRGRRPDDDHTPAEERKEAGAGAGEPPSTRHIGKGRPGGLPALSGVKSKDAG